MPLRARLLITLTACLLFFSSTSPAIAAPALRVLKPESSGHKNLLGNSGFEEVQNGASVPWRTWKGGYTVAPKEGRNGSGAVLCENSNGTRESGISQSLALNRTNAVPIVVRGWSKAENVSGAPDNGYSIYVDLVYTDGTPLWGQTGNFHCGTHDWQLREFVIVPDRPVRSVTVYGLFRGHTGRVWFDDISVEEIGAANDSVIFQALPVEVVGGKSLPKPTTSIAIQDGFSLQWSEQAGGVSVAGSAAGGFMVRDHWANSDFMTFENGTCAELDLSLKAEMIARSNHIVVRGHVADTRGQDRAVTLVFALPIDATGWRWGEDIRRERVIDGKGEFANVVSIRAGATGTQSFYPIAPVWSDSAGIALGIDMARPAVYRLGYHAGLKQLFIAYDFGLCAETTNFPSAGQFEFVLYRFDARHGFRAAWQKFTEIFPEHFVVRSKEQGLWMPFTDVSKVPGWEDFGFKYHEGNNNVPWDDTNGVLSFRYTEPMTWWMRMAKEVPRTPANAVSIRDQLAGGRDAVARLAQVSRVAAMHNDAGEPAMLFRDTPWCDGAVWSLNPNPWLGGTGRVNAATVHWNDAIKEKLYGPAAKGRLDGEYLDSLKGYVTADLNFRREHFRSTTVPLTFSGDSRSLALFKGLAVFEFTKWLAEDVHRMDKLMFANGVPYRFTYLCPWLDVLGTETDWLREGKYQPSSISQMDLWRTLSGRKPYLLLMNSDYDKFTPDLVEKYFERCLFYGMWPGFFSHNASENPYWLNPRWFERDRPLFRKYIPLVRRVAHAGWQPVTGASTDNAKVSLERFGPAADGKILFTLFNDTALAQHATVTLDLGTVGLKTNISMRVLLGDARQVDGGKINVRLGAQRVAVVEVH